MSITSFIIPRSELCALAVIVAIALITEAAAAATYKDSHVVSRNAACVVSGATADAVRVTLALQCGTQGTATNTEPKTVKRYIDKPETVFSCEIHASRSTDCLPK